jgi:two-component sensor histidine kinase
LISLVLGTYAVFVPAIGNLLFGLITLFWIKLKRDFITAAKFYLIILYLLVFGNLNFNDGTMHVGSPFWIMLLNILAIYILGVRWGLAFLSVSLMGYLYYLHFVLPYHMDIMSTLSKETYISVYYEAFFALFLLGYIIFTILRSGKESDAMLKKQNTALTEQNATILLRDEEKTTMLKEIHHRVKNNLQVITSLLRLQMHEIDNDVEADKFRDSINRVLTMAMIHEKMYQSEELSRINLEDYFSGLSKDLLDSYQINYSLDLSFEFQIDRVGLKSIVPLALIYNELFTNTLKHAFDGIENPAITLTIGRFDDTYFLFTYTDNGNWKAPNESSTFGQELIASLTDQLEGEMAFEDKPQTKYTFKFKHLEM